MAAIHSGAFKRDAVRIASTSGLTRRQIASDLALPQSVWRNGSILARSNSGPARPYMARLRVFRRLI
jgi:transposase